MEMPRPPRAEQHRTNQRALLFLVLFVLFICWLPAVDRTVIPLAVKLNRQRQLPKCDDIRNAARFDDLYRFRFVVLVVVFVACFVEQQVCQLMLAVVFLFVVVFKQQNGVLWETFAGKVGDVAEGRLRSISLHDRPVCLRHLPA